MYETNDWVVQDTNKRLAEELLMLRERLGPGGTEMLRELTRLREESAALKEYEPTPVDVSELLASLARAESEVAEQCRINAMGAQRELRLMAIIEEQKRELSEALANENNRGVLKREL